MGRVPDWFRGFIWGLAGVSFWNPAAAGWTGRADVEARASPQGAAGARVLAAATNEVVGFRAGAETAAAPGAPLRHAALGGASLSLERWDISADARAAPEQFRASSVAAELAVRRSLDPVAVSLAVTARRSRWASCDTCADRSLSAAGGAIEIEATPSEQWRGAVRAAASAIELRDVLPARRAARSTLDARDPWDRYGSFTLDWAERWELSGRVERAAGPWTLSLSGAAGAPAQDGALFARGGLRLQRRLGRFDVAAAAAVAHLAPSGQLCVEGSLAIGVRLGGVP